jgi:acetyl esterase
MKDYAEVPGLWTLDVLWARDMHTPNKSDQADPRASPLLQKLEKAFKSHPPTWIGVADMDPLKNDGEAYTKLLQGQGVEVELKTYVGELLVEAFVLNFNPYQ